MKEPRDKNASAGPVPVVTAFLWRGDQILLALRSDQASTFPGHWAGISGYLEGDDPAAWARKEIEQECGLDPNEIILRSVGAPLDVAAPDLGRTFRVHPFLFSIPDEAQVRPDWEAQKFAWITVDEMLAEAKSPAVPRLYDAFRAVWPPQLESTPK